MFDIKNLFFLEELFIVVFEGMVVLVIQCQECKCW